MMLLFNDSGYEVLTNAWTVAAKNGKTISIAYTWGAGHISFFDSATGVSRIDFQMTMKAFMQLANGARSILDLRGYQ